MVSLGWNSLDCIKIHLGLNGLEILPWWRLDSPNPSKPALWTTQLPREWEISYWLGKAAGPGVNTALHLVKT